ncbi:MAG TPA: OsmC family protein [Gemmatimonadaceae bacterium]|jgi:organic hydroperoxide reductase OsmC/OhrA|nr:MAG: peroxiredoxin [Gemmatimonadetes bacterium SCN 70-22]HMN10371.1 OsmC family protein [Gemmatimonadaceae bacterium]
MPAHRYTVDVAWTGNLGTGTATYRGYSRAHQLSAPGKAPIAGSSDPMFRGDAARYSPEELLVGALSACHMLWFLHLCADSGVVLESYRDAAEGTMVLAADGGGHFTEVTLHPDCTYRDPVDPELIRRLHDRAHALCFIASSMNFPVRVEPVGA